MAQRVAEMLLVFRHHVDGEAIGHLHRVAERLLDDHVRRVREFPVGVELVARMQPHQHLRIRQLAAVHRLHQLAQDVIVMAVERSRRRRQRDQLARRIGADPREELAPAAFARESADRTAARRRR